jgi:hypothetical protein
MRRRTRRAALAAALAATLLAGCAGQVEEAGHKAVEPYSLDESAQGLSRVRLTEQAAVRLAVTTAAVTESRVAAGALRKVIPYGAIIYDTKGATFTYTSPERLVYVRASVVVDYIDGNNVFLTDGPPVGTQVVTAGAAELYGIEFGLGK